VKNISLKLIILFGAFLVILSSASALFVGVSHPSEPAVGEEITIEASATSGRVDRIRLQQLGVSGYWETIAEDNSCPSLTCRASTNFEASEPGDIDFRVKADLPDGTTEVQRTTISFSEQQNTAPTVDLISPENDATVGTSVNFDWSSSDADGDDILHTMQLEEDPDDDTIEPTRQINVGENTERTVELDEGEYLWRIKADDETDTSFSEVRSFTVNQNQEPSASFSISDSSPLVNEQVTFDASGSSDDIGISEYRWDLDNDGDFDDGTGVTRRYSFTSTGSKTVRLKVFDSEGLTATATRTLNVRSSAEDLSVNLENPENDAEVDRPVDFSWDSENEDTNTIFIERKDSSGDTPWNAPNIRLNLGSAEDYSTSDLDQGQEYVWGVEVESDGERLRSEVRSFTVSDEDTPPTDSSPNARFDFNPTNPVTGQVVRFDGSASNDPDGIIDSYQWDIDNDNVYERRGIRISERFSSSGPNDVTLKVVDNNGRTGTRTRTVNVGESQGETSVLEVLVEEMDGDNIENARVRVSNGETIVQRTNRQGRTSFSLEEGEYELRASRNGYIAQTRDIEIDEGEDSFESFRLETEQDTDIRITNIDYPSSVCRGSSFVVDVTVANQGDQDEIIEVSGDGFGSLLVNQNILIRDGESRTTSLRFTNVRGNDGEFSITASNSDSDTQIRDIDIRSCVISDRPDRSATDMTLNVDPMEVVYGDTVSVNGYVMGTRGRTNVDIRLSGRLAATVSTEPDGYYQAYVRPQTVGAQTVTASSGGRTASGTLSVLSTATVQAIYAPDKVFEGERFEVCGDVSSPSTPKVYLLRDGSVVTSKNQKGEVCFDVTGSEPGDHSYEIRAVVGGQRSSASREIEVLEAGSEVSSFPDSIASVRSEPGIVKVEIYNTNQDLKRYKIDIDGVPRSWVASTDKEVVLDKGERKTVYFYINGMEEGSRNVDINVRSGSNTVYSENIDVWIGGTTEEREIGFFERVGRLFSR